METETTMKSLHPLEVKVLRTFAANDIISSDSLMEALSFNQGQCNQVTSWLSAKNYISEKERIERTFYELTELGMSYRDSGTPEERILGLLSDKGPMTLPEIAAGAGLENRDIGSAYGQMSKEGLVTMEGDKRVSVTGNGDRSRIDGMRRILDMTSDSTVIEESRLVGNEKEIMNGISKKRGAASSMFRASEREEVLYRLSSEGVEAKKTLERQGITGEEIGTLTPEMIASGEWKEKGFGATTSAFLPRASSSDGAIPTANISNR